MERLTGLDASFLYNETPTLHMHTLKLAIIELGLDGAAPIELARDEVVRRLWAEPAFRRRVMQVPGEIHHPVWVETDEIDLAYHVRSATVEPPGTGRELDSLVGALAEEQLDRSHPLWQVWLIDGLADGRLAVLVKIHHAVADGAAATALLASLMSTDPADHPAPITGPSLAEPPPSRRELVNSAARSHRFRARRLPGLLGDTRRRVQARRRAVEAEETDQPRPILDTPPTSFNRAISARRSIATRTFSLDTVKRVKNAHGATINDVLLTMVGGALRDYLLRRGELPERTLVAGVPVSSAPPGEEPRRSGNKVSNIFVALRTDIADPVQRLAAVHDTMGAAKRIHNALGADLMENWMEYAPPVPFRWFMRQYSRFRVADHHRAPFNVVVSNVPGPREPLYVAGTKLGAIFSAGPILEGIGLNLTAWSYVDQLHVMAIACAQAVSDPHDITDAMGAVLDELDRS